MKVSQIAAKAVVRIFFVLLLIALVAVVQGDTSKLHQLYLAPKHLYMLAFPVLLIIGFVTLLVMCAMKKYQRTDLNWMLVVNTIMLAAYGVTLYLGIAKLIK